jgi:predicted amidohydrolase YtcJ
MGADRTGAVVVRGALVRTLDPARPEADGLVVRDGRIERLLAADDPVPEDADVVDLGGAGACVLPGFTDAHVHFPSWASTRQELDLRGTGSLAEAVAAVRAALDGLAPGAWLRGRGWRDEEWADGRPTRQALDAVVGDARVALVAQDGHSLWLSSAALGVAGGDLAPEGVVERAGGEPNGILRETACWHFFDTYATPTPAERLAAMRAALPVAAAAGVVAIHDKDGGRGALELFHALGDELTLRVWQSLPLSMVDELAAAGIGPSGEDDGFLRLGYLKGFMDGTLGSRTARLLDGTGVSILDRDTLTDLVRRAAAIGFPVAVHAIGDQANRDALDAFEATRDARGPRGLRHRIEHAQCVAPEDVPRFAELGVTASVQYSHATSDRDLAERIWADRLEHAYPFRALVESGARLVAGSDAPVEPLDPLEGLRAAVNRTLDDRPPWRGPEAAVPLDDALDSFTVHPAWLCGDEDRRGRLSPGFAADLVVLDHDPYVELTGARVVATMLAGRWTFGAP